MTPCRVLLVDDEAELVYTLAERLEMRGFEVDALTDGSAALSLLRDKEFDIAIVDLKMPGLSGHALVAHLKETRPRLPVIMVTGQGPTEESRDENDPGADLVLYKPIGLKDLLSAMERLRLECANA